MDISDLVRIDWAFLKDSVDPDTQRHVAEHLAHNLWVRGDWKVVGFHTGTTHDVDYIEIRLKTTGGSFAVKLPKEFSVTAVTPPYILTYRP